MPKNTIRYKSGYECQLVKDYIVQVNVKPDEDISFGFITLSRTGELIIKKGYAWDGATFLPDSTTVMRGSVTHDALYQLMREGKLDRERWRNQADIDLKTICMEDRMSPAYAWFIYLGLRWFGKPSTMAHNEPPVIVAPVKLSHTVGVVITSTIGGAILGNLVMGEYWGAAIWWFCRLHFWFFCKRERLLGQGDY